MADDGMALEITEAVRIHMRIGMIYSILSKLIIKSILYE
jgi:hypothetical protein